MNQNWKEHPKLKEIHPKKVEIIELIIEDSKHKTMEEILPNILTASKMLSNQGLSFTQEEMKLLWDIFR